jgi:hypothetical protein
MDIGDISNIFPLNGVRPAGTSFVEGAPAASEHRRIGGGFVQAPGGTSASNSSDRDKTDPLWWLSKDYQPYPQFDVSVPPYTFRYRDELGYHFLARGRLGDTLEAVASDLQYPMPVIKHWATVIRGFGVSIMMAHEACQTYWERFGQSGMVSGDEGFNAASWLKFMATKFPGSWTPPKEADGANAEFNPFAQLVKDSSREASESANELQARLHRIWKDSQVAAVS